MSDDDLRRLTDADPMQGQPEPDLTALRARVIAEANGEVVTLRPRRQGFLIAGAVAASIALLAGGIVIGTAVERGASGDLIAALPGEPDSFPAINSTPGVPDMAGPMGPGRPIGPGGPGAPEIGSADAAGMSSSAMIWPGFQVTLEPGPGLTNETGVAAGYLLEASDIDRTALARQLATVFEVPGTPRTEDGSVWVGPNDGSQPQVWVSSDAIVSWSFYDPTRNPWECIDGRETPEDVSPGNPGGAQLCPDSPAPPSEREARSQARDILSALGITDAGAVDTGIDWETNSDGVITTTTAWQTVEGARTQLSWSMSFDGVGPLWANGFSAGLQRVPDYPIVGARTAVLRSQLPRWSAFGPTPTGDTVVPMAEGQVVDGDVGVQSQPRQPATLDPRRIPVQWDPAIAQSAELTLAQYWTPDGGYLLLPAYRYTTADDRGEWMIIAVADSVVNFGPFFGR